MILPIITDRERELERELERERERELILERAFEPPRK